MERLIKFDSMRKFSIQISKGQFKINGFVQEIGQDILVSLWGGTRPHIGAVGIAIPRPSLENKKKWSATSSNFTFIGHKEDALVKKISEKLAARLRKNTVVTAGIHWDNLTSSEIKTIQNLTPNLVDQILRKILPISTSAEKIGRKGQENIHKPKRPILKSIGKNTSNGKAKKFSTQKLKGRRGPIEET